MTFWLTRVIVTVLYMYIIISTTYFHFSLPSQQTDDKGVFSTSLSEEYKIAADTFTLSKNTLRQLASDSFQYIFDSNCKDLLQRYFTRVADDWKWSFLTNDLFIGTNGLHITTMNDKSCDAYTRKVKMNDGNVFGKKRTNVCENKC